MSTIQIKTDVSIDELIKHLNKLDTHTLTYLINSLKKIQLTREQKEAFAMSEAMFWNYIHKIDWQQKDSATQLLPLISALASAPVVTIYQFSERLAFFLHQIDGPAFAKPLEDKELGFSADTFLYARCLAVAKGKTYYNQLLQNPNIMPTDNDFEALLSVAEKAYLQKTGKGYPYIPTINYESFFNQALWGENAIAI